MLWSMASKVLCVNAFSNWHKRLTENIDLLPAMIAAGTMGSATKSARDVTSRKIHLRTRWAYTPFINVLRRLETQQWSKQEGRPEMGLQHHQQLSHFQRRYWPTPLTILLEGDVEGAPVDNALPHLPHLQATILSYLVRTGRQPVNNQPTRMSARVLRVTSRAMTPLRCQGLPG